jgi:CRISPR-associated exonuclease Cas4
MFTEDELLPISALQHLLFCPRQCALIHVEQLWAENRLTIEGRHLHQKADSGRGETRKRRGRSGGAGDGGGGGQGGPGVRISRSLPLRSLVLGLSGQADVVEFRAGTTAETPTGPKAAPGATRPGVPLPVEYKRGRPKKDGSDRVQLCAQALCLEEMLGVPVRAGALYYAALRRRDVVPIDDDLRRLTLDTIERLHTMIRDRITPLAKRMKKCDRCSLLHLCLPDVLEGSESASRYIGRSLAIALAAAGGPSGMVLE